jgi:hypothetical protein
MAHTPPTAAAIAKVIRIIAFLLSAPAPCRRRCREPFLLLVDAKRRSTLRTGIPSPSRT